jgi:hypothetical protein
LDITGLVNSIIYTTASIDSGRKGFAIIGKEREGRINYEDGIDRAMSAFKQASNQRFASTADPQALILAEYTFITQEFQLYAKSDKDSLNSLTKAIQFFDDAFLALKTVENKTQYQGVENSIPHDKDYRVKGFPKDSFHIACHGHKTRLKNILKAPGIDPIEKALLKQRFANLSTAQTGYVEKQRKALSDNK